MLTHLVVRDFAIIDQLELELHPGMTVLTGETGAGKSILIDALGLLLGDRADTVVIRHGCERAELSVTFDLSTLPAARTWLAEHDLAGDGSECILRRTVSREGRSRAYINGSAQPLQTLRQFGELLVDIHGQHEHQSLTRRDVQRQLLDDFAGHQSLLDEVSQHYRHWYQLQKRLTELQNGDAEREARRDLLRFQTGELAALDLTDGEWSQLEDEHRRLAHAGQLLSGGQQALTRIYEDDDQAIYTQVSQIGRDLDELGSLDNRLAPINELLAAALIQLQEASDELRRYLQSLDLDPERLDWVEQRLVTLQSLARKHRTTPDQLPLLLNALQQELDQLDGGEFDQEQLERELDKALGDYRSSARRLSKQRQAAAVTLGEQISRAMQELGMGGGRFSVAIESQDQPSALGQETVEFQVSANQGQPLQALSRVASGGELARISLAIQVIITGSARIPTLIFDEVDTGIGGGIAEVVGRRLRMLGGERQILCVTHLPQVAAQGHHHFKISKATVSKQTRTRIARLDQSQRVEEVARMLGGLKLTDRTLDHAREMIHHAQQ